MLWVLPTRGHFLCIPHHNHYYAVFTNLQTASSFSFHLPACFFIYTCVISHKFVLASLWKLCGFFLWFLIGRPLLLFLNQPRSKGFFILRQMTLRLTLNGPAALLILLFLYLPATYIRHSRDKCWNLLLKFECH